MKPILAIAAVGMLALASPAFAQSSGSPGATGTGATGSGHNLPGTAGETTSHVGAMQKGGSMKMKEGRAASQGGPTGDKANDAPTAVRGDQDTQEQKAK